MHSFNSFADIHQILDGRSVKTKRSGPSPEYMLKLLDHLGNPQQKLKVIHVAGTSGKTSTSYYVAALLKAAGHKVGLTISPYIDEINERVQIDLTPLPEATFVSKFERFWELAQDFSDQMSYFELCIAFALWEFAAQKVDYAVVEVGIGGLIDSTNVFDQPDKVCIITDIGYDHMDMLGNTLAEIATHKAGIIQAHNPVFCYQQEPEVMEAIRSRATQKQGDLHLLSPSKVQNEFTFLPLFQRRNFGLALAAVEFILNRDEFRTLPASQIDQAAHTIIPARMEIHQLDDKTIVLDTAHNPQKLQALAASMQDQYKDRPIAGLLSFPADRTDSLDAAMHEILPILHHVIVTTFPSLPDGSHGSVELADLLAACQRHDAPSLEAIAQAEEAFRSLLKRPEPILLVTGSTYLLNRIRPLVMSRV